MSSSDILFFILGALTLYAAVKVVMTENALLSALHLVMTMVGTAGLFFLLHAPFIGAVQIMVYAGAVMVLFVMVMMLIDTKKDVEKFSGGTISLATKGLAAGLFAGFIAATLTKQTDSWMPKAALTKTFSVQELSHLLFTKYIMAFEILGFILLVIPVGVVALSRTQGGTHDR